MNFAARLMDMEEAEREYRALPADARLAKHGFLPFYELLTTAERAVLERRFPGELAHDPEASYLTGPKRHAIRVAWDFRSRELVLAMLGYADEVISARLDLGGRLLPDADAVGLALTATGSIVELARPKSQGLRAYVYRPSARPGGEVRHGHAVLHDEVRLGNRIQLGDLVTSEVLVLATGHALPEHAPEPRFTLFGEAEGDAGVDEGESRLDAVRFRIMAEALSSVDAEELPSAEARLVAVAIDIQGALAHRQSALPLGRVARFTTNFGLDYEVEPSPSLDGERYILIGTRPDGPDRRIVLPSVDVGDQRLVVGAPLVMRVSGGRLAIIPEVAAVTPLPA